MPTWRGTPANLVEEFIDFVRTSSLARRTSQLQEIRTQIEDFESRKYEASARIQSRRKDLTSGRTRLAEYTESLVPLDNMSRFDESLIELMEHPAVIGIRTDSGGRLVIHLRLFKSEREDETEPAYVGDFEVYLLINQDGGAYETLPVTRTDDPLNTRWNDRFNSIVHHDDITYGKLTFYRRVDSIRALLAEGRLTEVLDIVIEQITKGVAKSDVQPGEPTWSGITSGLELMLARTIEISVNRRIREAIKDLEERLKDHTRIIKSEADAIRSHNLALTRLRSELSEMEHVLEEDSFDEEAIRGQLRYITSLTGVMGVKFTDIDGHRTPVIHIRTSTVYQDKRYDLGDYELMLLEYSTYENSAAVVRVDQTRTPMGYGDSFYYHPRSTYYGGTPYNWFCFGNRATELRKLFRMGNFAEFAHMVVNSFNSINNESQYNIPNSFTEIPMDATWTPPVQVARSRRRRLTRFLNPAQV